MQCMGLSKNGSDWNISARVSWTTLVDEQLWFQHTVHCVFNNRWFDHASSLFLSLSCGCMLCHQYCCYETLDSYRENAEAELSHPCMFINTIHESSAGSSRLDAWAAELLTCRIPRAYYSSLTLTREPLYCTIHFLCVCATVVITVACI